MKVKDLLCGVILTMLKSKIVPWKIVFFSISVNYGIRGHTVAVHFILG